MDDEHDVSVLSKSPSVEDDPLRRSLWIPLRCTSMNNILCEKRRHRAFPPKGVARFPSRTYIMTTFWYVLVLNNGFIGCSCTNYFSRQVEDFGVEVHARSSAKFILQ